MREDHIKVVSRNINDLKFHLDMLDMAISRKRKDREPIFIRRKLTEISKATNTILRLTE